MLKKFQFYQTYRVEEYYVHDPDEKTLEGWLRDGATLKPIPRMDGWTSPRLGIRFDMSRGDLTIYRPDGQPIVTYVELAEQADELAHQVHELAHWRDELAHQRDELARRRKEERQRAERLAEKLRALGIDPEA